MKKILLTTIFLSLYSFMLFSSNQNYFFDGNDKIELRTVPTKQYILYNDQQSVSSLLQNVRQVKKGTTKLPSQRMRITDYRITEWSVIESNEMQLSNISRNENVFQRITKNNSFFQKYFVI